jgi:hypothetical protein
VDAAVEAELDNLRAALAWTVADGDADLALRLVAPLAVNGTRIGYAVSGWAAAVVAMPGTQTHRLYPQVLAFADYAEFAASDADGGMRTCRAALDAAADLAIEPLGLRRVLSPLPQIAISAPGHFEEARRFTDRLLEAAREAGDPWELTMALVYAGSFAAYAQDVASGIALTDQALVVAERLGNPSPLPGIDIRRRGEVGRGSRSSSTAADTRAPGCRNGRRPTGHRLQPLLPGLDPP